MVCSTVIDPSGWTVAVASMALTSDSTDKGDSSRGSAPATLPAGSAAARDFRALHDGPDCHCEVLTAFVALVQAGTRALAL